MVESGNYQGENQYQKGTDNSSKSDGQALAGLVLGLVGIIAWLLPLLGYPVTIVGLILSALGQKSRRRHSMAIAGLVLSIIFLVVTLINSIVGACMRVAGM